MFNIIKIKIVGNIINMNEITFSEYIQFYEQNKDKIFMDEAETYPINKTNMNIWKDKVANAKRDTCETLLKKATEDEDWDAMQKISDGEENCDTRDNSDTYKLFAEIFENVIIHVSFTKMMEAIQKISEEIIKLEQTNNYSHIFMYVCDNSSKSNTWVSLLFTSF